MNVSTTFTRIDNPERFESYLPEKIIGRGSRSVVYLASCTRGRLRGRKVAIKAFTLSQPIITFESSPNITARSLHHPSLISLHSSFIVADIHYLVLELCEGGSLCELISTPSRNRTRETNSTSPLSESQLRHILRRIAEGVAHLHSQDIAHGDIRPHNVFITGDGRIKLAFGLSLLNCNSKSDQKPEVPHKILCKKTNYCAPETATNGPCSLSSDLWSLGCLIVTVLTGTCEFDYMKSNQSDRFPASIILTPQAQDLVHGLLQIDPQHRTPLKTVLAHPFLDPTLPYQNLNLMKVLTASKDTNRGSQDVEDDSVQTRGGPALSETPSLGDSRKFASKTSMSMPSLSISTPTATVKTTQETFKASSRPRLYSISSARVSPGVQDAWKRLSSRQQIENDGYSDSLRLPATAEAAKLGLCPLKMNRKALGEIGNLRRPFKRCGRSRVPHESKEPSVLPSGLLSPPETDLGQSLLHEVGLCDPVPIPSSLSTSGEERTTWQGCQLSRQRDVFPAQSMSLYEHIIPIPRINSPKSLKVVPLFPQTHKITNGQLVILPSRNLLVDLREGDRRAGGRGDRILCITPDGQEIKVYDAPHLSTPCLLSEPRETWSLDELPERYWKSYTFASKYLESVKKRTPWMIWYTPQAKFTVMSNGPKGDIHLSFPCASHGLKEQRYVSGELSESFVKMKIKFSRQQDTLELSRYAPSYKQRGRGEWITKSEAITVERLKHGGDLMLNMTPEEHHGLVCLIEGVKLAEAAEEIYMVASIEKKNSTLDDVGDHPLKPDGTGKITAIGLTPQSPEASSMSDARPTTPMAVPSEFPLSISVRKAREGIIKTTVPQ